MHVDTCLLHKIYRGTSVGDDCFGKTYPVLIMNALGALHQGAGSRFYVFTCLLETVLKVGVHTAHKCNSKMGTSQAAHFLCD